MSSRLVGKQLLLLQPIVEGIGRTTGEVLSRLLDENDVDVAVLQAIHCEVTEELAKRAKIYDFSMVPA